MADAEVIFDRQSPDGGECEGDKNRDDIPSTSVKRLKMAEDADSLCNPTGVFEDNHYDSEDELPLATYLPANQQHALPNKMRKKPLYTWKKEDIKPDFSDWKEYYGPKNSLSPLEIFSLFIDDEVVNLITDYSNLYASQHNHAGDISANEVRTFIGVLLLSGYNQFPRRAMYWENSDDAGNKLVYSAISRDRFTYIMQNIHTNDNTSLDQNDKFSKMRPLFDLINKKFQLFAPFEECHSVDESMVPYYGGHGSKQFIRGKPIRWGYKLWQGTTRQGYIEWFEPYQGSKTPLPEKYRPLGLGASVVLQFADVLQSNDIQPNAPFHVFCDNFFTSLPLLSELTARGLKCTGTLRENRISSCPLRNSKLIKKEIRGTFEYSLEKSTNVIVCKWNDNNVVTIASNVTSPLPTQPVKRFCQSKKKNVNIDQPHMIKKYNESMGGVDRADQNISLYRIAIRGKKWYFCLLAHCLDMAEQNAWQLHKRNGGNMDHLTFRRCIAAALLETFKKTTKRGPSKKSKNNHLESRYDRLDHLVIYQEKQTRCAVCHKQAAFRCEKCDVALHPKICFLSYHTKE
ncbi:piggyBac transposable element-derived protein 3-like isoform X2 [Sitophilus oryzae]|nr:piggyBac transposable element-derived protein 3-like isoform X2 [Sitophilus oryzae]XP_030765578.1 piggyBac transposable element-derived protein 3-like isoform X2 [Sitophilus oryzae]